MTHSITKSQSESRPITCEELTQMLKNYNIGKKPLAALLGWGETTVLVYLSQGQIPDNEYSRRLYSLYASPGEYLALLQKNKNLLTPVAYRKSFDAVSHLLPEGDIVTYLDYIYTSFNPEMPVLRVNTLLFYSQVLSLTLYGQPLFHEEYAPDQNNLPYAKVAEYDRAIAELGSSKPVSIPDSSVRILTEVYEALDWIGPRALSGLLNLEKRRLMGMRSVRGKRSVSNEGLLRFYSELFGITKLRRLSDFDRYIQVSLRVIKGDKPAPRKPRDPRK